MGDDWGSESFFFIHGYLFQAKERNYSRNTIPGLDLNEKGIMMHEFAWQMISALPEHGRAV